jgi:hypothetical protein
MAWSVRSVHAMKKYILLLLVGTAAPFASAQLFSVGALGGVPVSDTKGNDESRPYVVGGSAELRLPAGFALEADALYRRLGNSSSFFLSSSPGTSGYYLNRERGNSWEFPLLGKYYFRRTSAWQPFVGTGFSFRTISRHDANNISILSGTSVATLLPVPARSDYREPLNVGAPIVAGVRFHAGRLALLPQVRYTRWGGDSTLVKKNEVNFLLGVSF